MPYSSTTQRKYGENPMKKKTGFKMKGPSLGGGSFVTSNSSHPFQQRETADGKTFEQLMEEGFSPKEAVQMMKHGATTGEEPQKNQDEFVPAYPGADISEAEYEKIGLEVHEQPIREFNRKFLDEVVSTSIEEENE